MTWSCAGTRPTATASRYPPSATPSPTPHTPGEPGSALAAITPTAPCGMFSGQRRCGKAEAARYGYGGGRDPVTVLTRLGLKLLDPDAELPE